MNELQFFQHEQFGKIRALEKDGEPWLVGKDVAEALGYQNVSKALSDHVDPEDKLNNETLSSLGQRGGWLINESGLYSLVLSSKLPGAKQFKRWVTAEVLPSIRKTGMYVADDAMAMAHGLLAAQRLIEQKDEKIRLLAPKAEFADECLIASNGITTTSIAKEYGISGAKLNGILKGLKIQYKQGEQWFLYSKHQDGGYTVTKTIPITRGDGSTDVRRETLWTMAGRKFIYEQLAAIGMYPQSKMTELGERLAVKE